MLGYVLAASIFSTPCLWAIFCVCVCVCVPVLKLKWLKTNVSHYQKEMPILWLTRWFQLNY